MGQLVIWNPDQNPDRVQVERMAWLGAGGIRKPEGPVPADSLVILPLDSPGDRAAVLVPDPDAGGAALNRNPLGAGLHLVRHGDLLEVAGRRFWVELRPVAEQSLFDPELHGAELFCAATRARFKKGDPIVACPGGQGQACGLVYSQLAWEAVKTCHGCGGRSDPEPWAPPKSPERSSLVELLARDAGEGEAS